MPSTQAVDDRSKTAKTDRKRRLAIVLLLGAAAAILGVACLIFLYMWMTGQGPSDYKIF